MDRHSSNDPRMTHPQSFIHENILEYLLDGVMSVGLDGHVRTFNPAAARMLGLDRDDVVGHTLADAFFAADGFEPFTQAILDAVVERNRTERRVVEVGGDGARRAFSMTTSYLRSPDSGDPAGVIAVFSDITEMQALREAESRMAKELAEQNAELKKSHRLAEERRERLDTVLKRVQVARVAATVLVIALFLGAGVWSWGGLESQQRVQPYASGAQAGKEQAEALRTFTLAPEEFASKTLLVGRLVPSREVAVASATEGHIAEIGFAYGQRVSQGTVLLRLDMDEARLSYQEAQVEYENAKKAMDDLDRWESGAEVAGALRSLSKARMAMEGAAAALKRSAFLLKKGLIPASQHENARRRFESQQLDLEAARQGLAAVRAKGGADARRVAKVSLDKALSRLAAVKTALAQDTVRAPISGVVQRPATPDGMLVRGRTVEKGETLLTIADVDRLSVLAPVDEVEVTSIRPGQPVTVRGDAFSGLVLRGAVSRVSEQPRAPNPNRRKARKKASAEGPAPSHAAASTVRAKPSARPARVSASTVAPSRSSLMRRPSRRALSAPARRPGAPVPRPPGEVHGGEDGRQQQRGGRAPAERQRRRRRGKEERVGERGRGPERGRAGRRPKRGRPREPGHQGGRRALAPACRSRMARQHHPLPPAVGEVLARECAEARPRTVGRAQRRVEPHRLAAGAEPPVELVVLVARERLVESARRLQRGAAERAQPHRVGRALRPAEAVARVARAERRRHRVRDGAAERRRACGALRPADHGRAGALERRHGEAHIVRRQQRARVAAHHDRVRGGRHRAVEPGRGRARGVGEEPRPGE